ncbi:hypothetical protein D3C80_1692250 [compost metagenome]
MERFEKYSSWVPTLAGSSVTPRPVRYAFPVPRKFGVISMLLNSFWPRSFRYSSWSLGFNCASRATSPGCRSSPSSTKRTPYTVPWEPGQRSWSHQITAV